MKKVTCSFCERTLQDGDNNKDIGNYSLCERCYKKFDIIIKYYIDKYKPKSDKYVEKIENIKSKKKTYKGS